MKQKNSWKTISFIFAVLVLTMGIVLSFDLVSEKKSNNEVEDKSYLSPLKDLFIEGTTFTQPYVNGTLVTTGIVKGTNKRIAVIH